MTSLGEGDAVAIADAIRILSEAGYRVDTIGQGSTYENGVEFTLDVQAPTRARFFDPTRREAKAAVIDAPEFDMHGQVVDQDETDDDVATDGGRSVADRRARRREFERDLESARVEHGEVRCQQCERDGNDDRALIDLSGADDVEEAKERWYDHVREFHEVDGDGE